MNKKLTLSIFVLSAALVLASCQIPTAPIEEAASSLQAASVQASVVEEIPTATAEPTAVPQPTSVPTAVPPATAGAEQAAQAYFETLRMRDHEAAADLVSEFSLMVFRMTRLDVIDQLMLESAGGMDYTGFEIVESSLLDEQTALVQVKYEGQVEGTAPEEAATEEAVTEEVATEEAATEEIVPEKESFEAVWAFRLENGQWKYNWNNLVDFRTLNVQFQTTGGVSMLPKEILRFTDHMQVNLLAQNRTK